MSEHDVGPFRLQNRRDQVKTAVCATALIRAGEPILSFMARRETPGSAKAVATWSRVTAAALGMKVSESGSHLINPAGTYVVAAMHEGMADPLLLSRLPLPLRYLVRDELFGWRHLGRFLQASRQIEVATEGANRDTFRIISQSRTVIESGESLVVFPQGSVLGVEIAFTKGAFLLADRLEVPLLPVVITGTHQVWEHPFNPTLRYGCPVSITVLEPIEVGRALESSDTVEHEMRALALANSEAPARRFDPQRDGFWDGYDYEIDPSFSELARQVRVHREQVEATI